MQIIRNLSEAAHIPDPAMRELVTQRINDLGGEDFDTTELGYFLVFQIGDTLEALGAQLGVSVLANRITGIRWNQPDFTPSFEFIEDLGFCYDMVIVLSDSGYGVELLIEKDAGVVDLISMCAKYATLPFPDGGPQ